MSNDELIFYKDCDLITGKSGDEPLYSCAECYRYDICKSAMIKEANNEDSN